MLLPYGNPFKYHTYGNPFKYHKEVLSLQPMFPPKPLDIFFPEGGCSEGLDAFRFFFKKMSLRQSTTPVAPSDKALEAARDLLSAR